MGIFNDRSKRALVGAMRECVCDTLMESATLTSKQATDKMNFVFENATYEQLLNVTINPDRDTNYLPSYVLEGAVAILHRACLTGREYIGKNAITEGAKLLAEETGAVITESMKQAALNSVNNGGGLKVVEKLLEEAALLQEDYAANAQTIFGISPETYNALRSARTDKGAALAKRRTNLISELTAKAKSLKFNDPKFTAEIWANDLIAAAQTGDVSKLSAVKRQIMAASREGIVKDAIKTLDTTPSSALSPRQLRKLQQRAGGNFGRNFGSAAKNNINPGMLNDVNRTIANQTKRMNPWVAGGLGVAGALGGAYLYNRYKQNQAAQQ